MGEGILLSTDLAGSWMRLADAALKHNLKEKAEEFILRARYFIAKEPYAPHDPDIIEAWRQAVVKYNERLEIYQSRGIQIEPIENPYEKPYREHLKDGWDEILSRLPADLRDVVSTFD